MKDYPLNIFEYIVGRKPNITITEQIIKNADKVMDMLSQEVSEGDYQIIVDRFKNKMSQRAVKEKYKISLNSVKNAEFKAFVFFRDNIGTLLSNDEAALKGIIQRIKEYHKNRLKYEEEQYNIKIKKIQKTIDLYDKMSESPLSEIEQYLNRKGRYTSIYNNL